MLLDCLRLDLKKEVERRELIKHCRRVKLSRPPDYVIKDKVYCRLWYALRRWLKIEIVAIAGPISYDVQVGDDVHRRHAANVIHDCGDPEPTGGRVAPTQIAAT